ncbi:MAG: TonB-dependent receptor plug domain-containing protein, partial [Bacteroidota bacterium]
SYVGYQKVGLELDLNADAELHLELKTSADLIEVEIVATKHTEEIQERTQISAASIPVAQIQALPTLGGEVDVLRAVQLLPGVSSGNEASSGLFVRGGSHDQNLILLDGVPIYNSFHLFGFLSVFNADAINKVELTKGGFPARYGGRLSSVLDIRLKEGNMNELKGTGTISPIATKFTLEGPLIKDKMAFIVSGRRTFADLIIRPITRSERKCNGVDGSTGYFFHDMNVKLNYKFSNKDRLYLSFFGGRDRFDDTYNRSFVNQDSLRSESFSEVKWGNTIGVLRWNHVFNNKLFGNLTFFLSNYHFEVSQDDRNITYNNEALLRTIEDLSRFESDVKDKGFRFDFDYVPSPNHYIRFGLNATNHHFAPGVNSIRETDTANEIATDTVFNNSTVNSWEYFGYFEDDFKVGQKMKFNIGVHASAFSLKEKTYFSVQPRLSARYLVADNWSLKAAFSTMAQPVHLLVNSGIGLPTDLWISPTKDLKPQQSWQAALGVATTLNKGIELSIEGYYKEMTNLVAYKEGASFFLSNGDIESKITQGSGRAYGAEVFLQKKTGKTTGWIGYTLSWSDRQFDLINEGQRFPFKYDHRHDFTVAVVHRLSKKVRLSGTWVFTSGNATNVPIREFDINTPNNDQFFFPIALDYGERNSFRLRPYHRLDLSVGYFKQKRWGEQSFNFSVYNAYNRRNPFYIDRQYVNDGVQFIEQSLFPIIPSFSYNFSF